MQKMSTDGRLWLDRPGRDRPLMSSISWASALEAGSMPGEKGVAMTHQKRCSAVVNMLGTIHAARAVGSWSEATTERKVAMQKMSTDGCACPDRLDKNPVPLPLSSVSDALKARRDRHKSRLPVAMIVEGSVQKSDRSGRLTGQDRLGQNRSPYSQFAWAGALEARLLPGKMGVLMRPKKKGGSHGWYTCNETR